MVEHVLSMKTPVFSIKHMIKNLFVRCFFKKTAGIEAIGTRDVWTIKADLLTPDSSIICAGVGNTMTFERALAQRGYKVILLDPSPTGVKTAGLEENQHANITFLPVGLDIADHDVNFLPPRDAREGSWSLGEEGSDGDKFPCRGLRMLMDEHGFTALDLLKMDIEGFEYRIIDDILTSGIDVKQICIEIHHAGFVNIRKTYIDVAILILRLYAKGYRIIANHYLDFTFVKKDLL